MGRVISIASPHVAHAAEACSVPPQSGATSAIALAASAPNGQSSGSSTAPPTAPSPSPATSAGTRRHSGNAAAADQTCNQRSSSTAPGGAIVCRWARQGSVNEGSLGSTTA